MGAVIGGELTDGIKDVLGKLLTERNALQETMKALGLSRADRLYIIGHVQNLEDLATQNGGMQAWLTMGRIRRKHATDAEFVDL